MGGGAQEPGRKGVGGVQEVGIEGAGSGIPKCVGSGRNGRKLCNKEGGANKNRVEQGLKVTGSGRFKLPCPLQVWEWLLIRNMLGVTL